MSKDKKVEHVEEQLQSVESALSSAEQFIEKNQKNLLYLLAGIVMVVFGYWMVKMYYYGPLETEGQSASFRAQIYFEKDSFKLALNGDGLNDGFVSIASKYSGTKAGNLANYYAGVSYLQIGQFQKAIDHLSDFSTDDDLIQSLAIGAMGDAYLELGNKDKAVSNYTEAIGYSNSFTAPTFLFKLGLLQEELGKSGDALESYTEIKTKYKTSAEFALIEKYITRATLASQK